MTVLEIPTPDPRTLDDEARPFAEALASRYAIKRLIGRGGMGVVYLARDRRLARLVAIKTLPPALAADQELRERFLRESQTAAGMTHPNIVPVYGADEVDGHVFFVMAHVEGESLAAQLRGVPSPTPMTVAGYLRDVAAALDHAHRRGIIHRDIKPENILIERASGRALVTDFGIARAAEAAPLTATGQLLGTVHYVSPEQVSGDPIDFRSDIYSLGVVGYLALTGRFPFESEIASAVLVAHVTRLAPPVRSVAPSAPLVLASIIDRCLARARADRYASAEQLLGALDHAIRELRRQPAGDAEGRPRLISNTEANAVWHRAAALQESTGVIPRRPPVEAARDAHRDALMSTGIRLDDVRTAAEEAGIKPRYVEHALAEHGLARARGSAQGSAAASSATRVGWLRTVEQRSIEGVIPPAELDRLVNVLRDGAGEMGASDVSASGFEWRTSGIGHSLRVSIADEGDRSRIRVAHSLRRMAVSASVICSSGGAIVGAATAIVLHTIMRLDAPIGFVRLSARRIDAIAIAIGLSVAVGVVGAGIGIFKSTRNRERARIHGLTELLVAKAREVLRTDRR